MFALLADAVVILHVAFVLFVVFGGFLVLRWRGAAWLHIPAALWGFIVEGTGWVCPLTPLENHLRARASAAQYSGDFVDHYIVPLLYPAGLGRPTQWILAVAVVVVNVIAYSIVIAKRRRMR